MAEDDRDNGESRRILARVERENAGGGFVASGMPGRKGAIPSAEDDWIEHWGTRIGRGIGLAITAAVLIWALLFALNLI